MKIKYVIQIKRRYYWEDILSFYDKKSCFVSYMKLLNDGFNVRVIEIVLANLSC